MHNLISSPDNFISTPQAAAPPPALPKITREDVDIVADVVSGAVPSYSLEACGRLPPRRVYPPPGGGGRRRTVPGQPTAGRVYLRLHLGPVLLDAGGVCPDPGEDRRADGAQWQGRLPIIFSGHN